MPLEPVPRPTTDAAQRQVASITELRDWLTRLEGRPGVMVGVGNPSGVAQPGSIYIDKPNGHVWVSAGANGWVTADMQRGYNSDASTYCTTGNTGDFAGPDVTLYVPPGGYVGVFMDAELQMLGTATANIYLYDGVDVPGSFTVLQSGQPSFERKVTSSLNPFGTSEAYGEWLVFPATAGKHTFRPRYLAATTGQNVCFRNRKLWIVTF